MHTPITAVALRTVRHNDRTSILTAWSPDAGRLSLLMPDGNSKESRRRRALTMPLCMFEGQVNFRHGSQLAFIHDFKPWFPGTVHIDVTSHPVRATIAIFIAEVLTVVTREGDKDPALWALIIETAQAISKGNAKCLANLPVMFLMRLAAVLGIEPDFTSYRKGMGLDMTEGIIRTTRPVHEQWLNETETHIAVVINRAASRYRHPELIRLSREVRSKTMDRILQYFAMHTYPLDKLRSLDVLKTVFDS